MFDRAMINFSTVAVIYWVDTLPASYRVDELQDFISCVRENYHEQRIRDRLVLINKIPRTYLQSQQQIGHLHNKSITIIKFI